MCCCLTVDEKIRRVNYNCWLVSVKKTNKQTKNRLILASVVSCFTSQPNQLTQFGQRRRRASSLALSVVLTGSPPFSVLCLLCFLSHPRTPHTFQLLYSTVVNNCHTEEQSPAMWRKKKSLFVNFIMWSTVLSDITSVFGCTLALLNRSSLCGRVCALSVFHGRMCAVCLFVGQDGCVGHPVTLIPSQTWCVECKYELF